MSLSEVPFDLKLAAMIAGIAKEVLERAPHKIREKMKSVVCSGLLLAFELGKGPAFKCDILKISDRAVEILNDIEESVKKKGSSSA